MFGPVLEILMFLRLREEDRPRSLRAWIAFWATWFFLGNAMSMVALVVFWQGMTAFTITYFVVSLAIGVVAAVKFYSYQIADRNPDIEGHKPLEALNMREEARRKEERLRNAAAAAYPEIDKAHKAAEHLPKDIPPK